MTDTKLLSLLRVTETGSFTMAAESLSLTQPAVSQHIRQLEAEFGVKLFEHAHNRFRLTREGELMVSYARRILAMYSRMDQALRSEREQVRSLTVGVTHTAESSAIIEALAKYMQHFGAVNLKILTSTKDDLYAMLKNYELDFAFVEGSGEDPALEYIMVDTDRLILAVPPEHPLAGNDTVTVEELKKETLILRLPNSNTRDLFSAALESRNLSIREFNVIMEINSVATIKDLVKRGFGVTVLALSACREDLEAGTLAALDVKDLNMTRQINLAAPKDFGHADLLRGIVAQYEAMKN